jgi:hypothetical protein
LRHFIRGWSKAGTYFRCRTTLQNTVLTTALALQSLLELRAAKLPWQGSEWLRDQLIGSAVCWLLMNFEPARNGWRAEPTVIGEAYEGLTLQIYSILLRSRREASTGMSEEVRRAMYATARSWEERKISHSSPQNVGLITVVSSMQKAPVATIETLWRSRSIRGQSRSHPNG